MLVNKKKGGFGAGRFNLFLTKFPIDVTIKILYIDESFTAKKRMGYNR